VPGDAESCRSHRGKPIAGGKIYLGECSGVTAHPAPRLGSTRTVCSHRFRSSPRSALRIRSQISGSLNTAFAAPACSPRQVGSRPKNSGLPPPTSTHPVPPPRVQQELAKKPSPLHTSRMRARQKHEQGGGPQSPLAPPPFSLRGFLSSNCGLIGRLPSDRLGCRRRLSAAPFCVGIGFQQADGDLVRFWAFSPIGPCSRTIDVRGARPLHRPHQLKSIPDLAGMERRHAFIQCDKECARLVTLAFAASSPCAWNLGVSFFSISSLDSLDFLESSDPLDGLRNARCATTVFSARMRQPPLDLRPPHALPPGETQGQIKTTMTSEKTMSFHVYPSCEYFSFNLRLPDATSTSVGHSAFCREYTSEDGTPSIGPRWPFVQGCLCGLNREGRSRATNYLRFDTQVKSVKSQAEAPENDQRRQVAGHRRHDLHGTHSGALYPPQSNKSRPQQHVQQTAAYLLAAVGLYGETIAPAERPRGQNGHWVRCAAMCFPQ